MTSENQLDPKSDAEAWAALVRATWDERAPDWDLAAESHALSADRTADIARLAVSLDLHHGSTLLDAGCGGGQFSIAFAHLGCRVTGIDISSAMIDRARMHARDRGVDIDFRVGDIATLADPANTFDAVHARVVLQFVRDPNTALRHLRRVLKPVGRMFVSVPGSLSPIYFRSWRRFTAPQATGNTFLVPWELEELLRQNGFTIIEQWGEFGRSLSGDQNELELAVRNAPVRLQQAAATTWGFIAT
jgi:2-polyprenyl-3-methyl-5-hydroxy-6-metoxy-1,4-benzoquinol methylase